MSVEFESLVRPFQTNDVTPAQTYFVPGQIGVPNLRLNSGRSGQGKTFHSSISIKTTYYCHQYENEKPNEAF